MFTLSFETFKKCVSNFSDTSAIFSVPFQGLYFSGILCEPFQIFLFVILNFPSFLRDNSTCFHDGVRGILDRHRILNHIFIYPSGFLICFIEGHTYSMLLIFVGFTDKTIFVVLLQWSFRFLTLVYTDYLQRSNGHTRMKKIVTFPNFLDKWTLAFSVVRHL